MQEKAPFYIMILAIIPSDTQNPIWSSWEPKFNLHNWAFDPQKITEYLLFTYSFLYSSKEWSRKPIVMQLHSTVDSFLIMKLCVFLPQKAQAFINKTNNTKTMFIQNAGKYTITRIDFENFSGVTPWNTFEAGHKFT